MAQIKKLSRISILHYIKLILRSLLFCAVLVFYILDRTEVLTYHAIIPIIAWLFFVVEMLLRFFPSRPESMVCQKYFARNYEPIDEGCTPSNQSWKRTALVAVVWLALNAVIGVLYFTGLIDRGISVLIAHAAKKSYAAIKSSFRPFSKNTGRDFFRLVKSIEKNNEMEITI